MHYFVSLAEAGSFGQAARDIPISQPALSTQIRDLELDLDVRLVERLPRGVRLTQAGEEMLTHMRRILIEVQDLQNLSASHGALRGVLKLGVIPTIAPYLLPPVLTALEGSDLQLQVRIREAQTDQLLSELSEGKLDAVIAVPLQDDPTIIVEALFDDAFLLAGAADDIGHLNASPERLRPTALDPDRLLLLDEGHCLADQALDVCDLTRKQTRVDLGASSLSTLAGLVERGFGLTFLPEIAIATETQAHPDLKLLRFADPEPKRQIALLFRASAPDDPRLTALLPHLKAVARRAQASS